MTKSDTIRIGPSLELSWLEKFVQERVIPTEANCLEDKDFDLDFYN